MVAAWMDVLLISCASTRITRSHVVDTRAEAHVKEVPVIAIVDDIEIREIFETNSIKWLNALGVAAIL